jgi:hypothetical protein
MKKVSELEGAELDYWVAKAIGNDWRKPSHGSCCSCQTCGHFNDECQCGYHDSWSQLGPLIEKYGKVVMTRTGYDTYSNEAFIAEITTADWVCSYTHFGNTKLIALCRCIIASVYGDEVDA